MSLSLEEYCERALLFLEEVAPAFARLRPGEAAHLIRDPHSAIDPHLERMLEGCALLAGRVDHKISSEFPIVAESMLQILYPHLTMVVPALSIAKLRLRDARAAPGGCPVPAGVTLTSRPVGRENVPCQYRTCYPVELRPLQLHSTQWQAVPLYDLPAPPPQTAAALRWKWTSAHAGGPTALTMDKVRLFLHGDRQLVVRLYETLLLHVLRVDFRLLDGDTEIAVARLAAGDVFQPVGFNLSEAVLPMPRPVFPGFGHLLEVLSFPEKYWFLDVAGWGPLREAAGSRRGTAVETVVYVRQTHDSLERNLSKHNFLLGCTPVINLFAKSAEPIDVHERTSEYRIIPSLAQGESHEVYSVQEVGYFDPVQGRQGSFAPFFGGEGNEEVEGYWLASRRAAAPGAVSRGEELEPDYRYWTAGQPTLRTDPDRGTEVYLQIVDRKRRLREPSDMMLDVRILCTNRDLPPRFQQGGDVLSGSSDGAALQAVLLQAPTRPLRSPLGRTAYWRLLSQNGLNHVPLTRAPYSREALQELLRLCDFSGPDTRQFGDVVRQMIDGIVSIRSRPIQAWVRAGEGPGLCRGQEVELELDERNFGSTGPLLFASVLERFFALYTALNSFSQLVAKTTQSKEPMKRWPPRAAEMQLL